ACLVGRVLRDRGDGGCGSRAAGGAAGSELGVADLFYDLTHVQTKFLGDDGADVGPRAGAQILRTAGDQHRTIGLDADVDLRSASARTGPCSDAAAHAADQGALQLTGGFVAVFPADRLGAGVQLAAPRALVGLGAAEVLLTELDRVHADLVSQLVHQP